MPLFDEELVVLANVVLVHDFEDVVANPLAVTAVSAPPKRVQEHAHLRRVTASTLSFPKQSTEVPVCSRFISLLNRCAK